MKRLLDYDEMNEILDGLDKDIIRKCKPIGFSNFGYPLDHYEYGHGDNHVIITSGTHASEIISNVTSEQNSQTPFSQVRYMSATLRQWNTEVSSQMDWLLPKYIPNCTEGLPLHYQQHIL